MRRAAIERLLPAVYQRAATQGGVLGALLDVMEALHAPSEDRLSSVDDLFSAYRAPDRLVPFLARWVALEHVTGPGIDADAGAPTGSTRLPVPVGRMRDLVARGTALARRRGTAAGLRAVIELATGVSGVVIEEPAQRPFHVVVRLPPDAAAQLNLVRHIAELEKPAATTCEVVVAGTSTGEE